MEALGITLLVVILILGGAVFFVFLQFLSTLRENHDLYQQILAEIEALAKKVDGLKRPAAPEGEAKKPE